MRVPLWKIAHARSGDKADRADIGLFAFDAPTYEVLKREVTKERLAAHFAGMGAGPVELWALDNIERPGFQIGFVGGGVKNGKAIPYPFVPPKKPVSQ